MALPWGAAMRADGGQERGGTIGDVPGPWKSSLNRALLSRTAKSPDKIVTGLSTQGETNPQPPPVSIYSAHGGLPQDPGCAA